MKDILKALLTVSLATLTSSATAQSGSAQFADGQWTLERLSDKSGILEGAALAPQGQNAPILTLLGSGASTAAGTQVGGFSGCNTFRGSAVFTPKTVRFGPLATTRKACPPEAAQLESRFLNVLSQARGVSLRFVEMGKPGGSRMVLSSGSSRLTFSMKPAKATLPVVPEPSMNTDSRLIAEWRRVGRYVGQNPPTLTLTADGKVSGFAGCNRFMGSYTLEGDTLKMGPLASTRMACLNPEAQAQETAFLEQLKSQPKFSVSGNMLSLILADGTRVEFQRPVN